MLHSVVAGNLYILLSDCLNGQASHALQDADAADRAFQQCARGLRQYEVSPGRVVSSSSRFTYRFERSDSGAVTEFTAELRPVRYGEATGGLRSYLIVQKFGEHATRLTMYGTPEDRPATPLDPPASVCEMESWPAVCEDWAARVK